MAETLTTYTQNLEREVERRTAELKEAKSGLEKAVLERTSALEEIKSHLEETVEERTKKLNAKLTETEEMNRLMIDRELKMVELKKEIAARKGESRQ